MQARNLLQKFFAAILLLQAVAVAYADVLIHDQFIGGSIDPLWDQPLFVTAANYTPNTAETVFVTSPIVGVGQQSLNYYTLVGTNEVIPIQLYLTDANYIAQYGSYTSQSVYYTEWYEYFEPGYPFPNGSQKLQRVYFQVDGIPESRKEIGVFASGNGTIGNTNLSVGIFCGQWGDSSLCNVGFSLNSEAPIETGQWVKLGLYVKLNAPGVSDGEVTLYKNDVLYVTTGPAANIRGNDTRGFSGTWFGGNFSMVPGQFASGSGSRFIGDVTLCDSMPCSGATPTPTPTAVPPIPANGNFQPWY